MELTTHPEVAAHRRWNMPDIMKFIIDEEANASDPAGHLMGLEEWSEIVARKLAAEEGIELTPRHWEIVHFLREHYKEHGSIHNARVLLNLLAEKFAKEQGMRQLYLLFPKGPVRQASRIAGLPLPAYSADFSFGSVR